MVSRSEIDLLDIRAEFKKLSGYSLYSAIKVSLFLKIAKHILPLSTHFPYNSQNMEIHDLGFSLLDSV